MTGVPSNLIPISITGLPQASSVDADARIVISQGGVTLSATVAQALAAAGYAPPNASYFVLNATSLLSDERVLQFNNLQFTPVDNGAGLTYVVSLEFSGATTPLIDSPVAVIGTSVVPAHSDHQHPINVSGSDPVPVVGLATPGLSNAYARSDHSHGAVPAFGGASSVANGTLGGVPQPLAGQQDYGLFGDGTWRLLPGTGTVTSVGLSLPSEFTVSGSPVTSSGTLTGSWATQAANRVFAGPVTGADATPTFRALGVADIPNLPASIITSGQLPIAYGGTNASTEQGARLNILPAIAGQAGKALVVNAGATDFEYAAVGTGSVTSVGLAGTAAEITVTGASPITGSGAWTLSLPAALTFTGKTISGGAFTGGTWNNGIIGGSTAAAGTFTDLSATSSAVISVNTSTNALRITQVGSGNALLVEDSTNPDGTPFAVNSAGKVIVGNTASVPLRSTFEFALQVVSATGYVDSSESLARFNNGAGAAGIEFNHSRGATVGTNTILQNNDDFGYLFFNGADGTGYIIGAQITASVDGAPGTNDMPGRLVFSTTADGASSPTERMRIASTGVITFGAAVASSSFRVTPTASSVNFIDIAGGASGTAATISAVGTDANLDLRLTPKGTGYVYATSGGIKFPDLTVQTTAATGGLSLAEVQAAAVSL